MSDLAAPGIPVIKQALRLLSSDPKLWLVINLRHGSARLTERGQWFARTLIEAAKKQ